MVGKHLAPARRSRETAQWPNLFGHLQSDMNRLFDDFWRSPERPSVADAGFATHPLADITENETEYRLSLEMPGMAEKDIDITVADGTLTVRGEKKQEAEREEARYHVRERSYGSYVRTLRLPPEADVEHITAAFENGVLNVVLPKSEEAKRQVRHIDIKKG